MRGTWQTEGGGGGGLGGVLFCVAIITFAIAAVGANAAGITNVVTDIIHLVITLVISMATLGCAALIAAYYYRKNHTRQHDWQGTFKARQVPGSVPPMTSLPPPETPALPPAHNELHVHFHGMGEDQAAEVIRKAQRSQP